MKTIHGILKKDKDGNIETDYFTYFVYNKTVLLNHNAFKSKYNNKEYSVFMILEIGTFSEAYHIINKAIENEFKMLVLEDYEIQDTDKAEKAWKMSRKYTKDLRDAREYFHELSELL